MRLATGHYARLVAHGDGALVARGADPAKDQSAMLARVAPELLGHARVPARRRAQARRAPRGGERGAGRGDRAPRARTSASSAAASCAASSIARASTCARARSSDTDGAVLGHHEGAVAFTIGQRRGLGVAAAEPHYVRSVDASAGIVTIAPLAALARHEVELIDATLHRPVSRVHARLRVHMADVGATVEPLTEGIRLHLDEPVFAVAPGQVAVLYDDDGVVVGAGTIAAFSPPRRR